MNKLFNLPTTIPTCNAICRRDYVALCNAMSNGDGKGWATRVSSEDELIEALKLANGEKANQYASIPKLSLQHPFGLASGVMLVSHPFMI